MAAIAERLPSSRELLRWYARVVWFAVLRECSANWEWKIGRRPLFRRCAATS